MKAADCKVVLTGATGGIGQAAAAALLQAGAALLLVGRDGTRLNALAASLAASVSDSVSASVSDSLVPGGAAAAPGAPHVASRIATCVADLNRGEDQQRLADAAAAWQANVLVHGAGLPSFGRFEDTSAERLHEVLQSNLLAPMQLTQRMLAQLRRRPRAQVVCIGSALGRIGLPGFSVYSASKFGLRGFAEALRRELADSPVRVQYLGPRSTRTGFNDDAVLAYNRATGTAMDGPERVAAALLRLLEDEAAERFIGFPERLAVRLNGAIPAWLDGSFKAHRRQLTGVEPSLQPPSKPHAQRPAQPPEATAPKPTPTPAPAPAPASTPPPASPPAPTPALTPALATPHPDLKATP